MGVFGISRRVLCGAQLCASVFLISSVSLADDPAPTSYPPLQVCDPQYMTTLQDKALAEIQRELQVNNAVITKPASVLALSCFDNAMTQAAEGGATFSDINDEDGALEDAINLAIGDSLTDYYSNNFGDDGDGITFEAGGSSGDCARLQEVWDVMKYSVSDSSYVDTLDDFRTTTENGTDIRGDSSAVAGDMAKIYKTGLEISTSLKAGVAQYGDDYFNTAHPNFCAYDPKSGKDALADSKICSVENGPDKTCSKMPAVPTGVAISYKNGSDTSVVWAYACLNPGCYFDIKGNASRIKVSDNSSGPKDGLMCSPKPSE